MKNIIYYIPYIIAAIFGFCYSSFFCAIMNVYGYEYSWRDVVLAILSCIMVYSLRGEDGIIAQAKQTFREFFGRKEQDYDNIGLDSERKS